MDAYTELGYTELDGICEETDEWRVEMGGLRKAKKVQQQQWTNV